jgi:hypothetical protein
MEKLWGRVVTKLRSMRSGDPWFALPVLTAMVLDAGISLACQPSGYWSNPALADEGNSAWGLLLVISPWAFAAGFLVYCSAMVGVLLHLSGVPQKLLGMFLLLAHSYGGASWCHVELPDRVYWWALMVLFMVEAGAFAAYWHLAGATDDEADSRSAI